MNTRGRVGGKITVFMLGLGEPDEKQETKQKFDFDQANA